MINKNIKVVGVTGTNGKTTVATMLYNLFTKLGHKTALLSTVEYRIGDEVIPARLTTPDGGELKELFAKMEKRDIEYCFMEASSHGLTQGRVDDIDFTGAIFTNITHEHLDYHKTFEEYMKAKRSFFDKLGAHAWALANSDDENGPFMLQNTKAAQHYYGFEQEDGTFAGDLQFEGKLLANTFNGIAMTANGHEIRTKLIGRFNAYNLLAVYGAAMLLDQDADTVATVLGELAAPRGRFEAIEMNGRVGIVDYAHTPDALENVLQTIHDIKSENQHVFTVIGCGGDRDREKRPKMARIAAKYSDHIFITSDNPRSESPEAILDDMEEGLDDPKDNPQVTRDIDRTRSIKRAVEIAEDGDIILVAGKGHEDYQIIGEDRIPFSDKEILTEALENL